MPYPFVLPTTSAFDFAAALASPTHPSLLRNATTYRGIVRDTLKRHKRLPPDAQAANLGLVVASLRDYLPYLFAVADGLAGRAGIRVVRRAEADPQKKGGREAAVLEWRPVLADARIPGKEPARVRVVLPAAGSEAGAGAGAGAASARALDHEIAFALACLGHAYTLQARAALQPLYVVTSVVPVGSQQRLAAIVAATKHLLAAAGVFALAARLAEASEAAAAGAAARSPPPCPEIAPPALRALGALALAEATLLAVLKDDPYPAAVAQDRNEHDREWMYKAPDLPKVRAHLFARLCLAAAEHASQAAAAAAAAAAAGLSRAFLRYLDDLRRTSRAKACRFVAVDTELGGQTGTALAWIHAAQQEMGCDGEAGGAGAGASSSSPTTGDAAAPAKTAGLLSRLKKERSEKREDRRVERGAGWGADAGRFEETRVLAMLDAKWTKQNDTINVQRVPPAAPLRAQMPSGREIHVVQPLARPALDAATLEALRAPPDPLDAAADLALASSSDEDEDDDGGGGGDRSGRQRTAGSSPVGAYPGTSSYY